MAPLSSVNQQKAVSLCMLALMDGGAEVTADQIAKLLAVTNVEVEPYWPALYAGIKGKAMDAVLGGGKGGGGGGGGGSGGGGGGGAAAAEEEQPAEKEEEEEMDMGGNVDMFGGDDDAGGGGDY